MLNEDFAYLLSKLRRSGNQYCNIPQVKYLQNMMLDAADALEILKKENDRLEREYVQDMICGAYVCKDAVLRQFVKWMEHAPDRRVDLNSLNALLCGQAPISKEEALTMMLNTGGREFRIWTPKGNLKVYAKAALDDPEDYPGVFIDIEQPDGHDLLCCVEYDSVADGIYARVYADGEEPSESIRFEDLD